MKQFKLTLVLTVLMSMVGLQAFAAWDTSTKIQVDGLYYYLDNDNLQAQVTSMPSGKYTGDIEIPFDIIYAGKIYSVTSIGESAFRGYTGITSVTIGNSVTSIGNYAFYGCSGLTSVTIPNSVMSIGEKAFSYCTKLTSLKVESGNTKFDSRDNCNAIIETASNKLIAGCNTTVIIPNSVTSIGQDAFRGSGLTGVIIPNSVTSIGENAFYYCLELNFVNLNSNDIVSKEHTYSDNIKTIFGNQVKKYVIGDDVTSIGDNAFYGCTGITSFIIGNNVTSIGYMAFYGCTGLATLIIPYKVTSIGAYAFRDCSGLESLIIGSGVTSYGNSAFQCSKLTSVTVLNPTPVAITQNVFTNRTNAMLQVPKGSKDAYKAADYWKEFKEINDDYKSLGDYIANSSISGSNNYYNISPTINNVKKVFIDLTKSTSNESYCYLEIKNKVNSKEKIELSSKYLQSTSSDNLVLYPDNNYSISQSIKGTADNNTYPWLYYNPENANEVIIDVKLYFGHTGYIERWQRNFGTSCVVKIETENTETSVRDIRDSSIKDDRYYNLQGQRVLSPKKGIYIINGKKVVVK